MTIWGSSDRQITPHFPIFAATVSEIMMIDGVVFSFGWTTLTINQLCFLTNQ